MILFIILAALAFVLFFIMGYAIGQNSANESIRHERELVVNLQAQNDCLQSRMLTMLDETIKGKTPSVLGNWKQDGGQHA